MKVNNLPQFSKISADNIHASAPFSMSGRIYSCENKVDWTGTEPELDKKMIVTECIILVFIWQLFVRAEYLIVVQLETSLGIVLIVGSWIMMDKNPADKTQWYGSAELSPFYGILYENPEEQKQEWQEAIRLKVYWDIC